MRRLDSLYLDIKKALISLPSYIVDFGLQQILKLYNTDINYQNQNGATLVHCAARYGDASTIQFFIEKGVDINAKNNEGNTALHIACIYSHYKTAKWLIAKGAKVNIRNHRGNTVLDLAFVYNRLDIIQFFIKKDVYTNGIIDVNSYCPPYDVLNEPSTSASVRYNSLFEY